MWVTKREWARHQRELRAALQRAERAEDALASERAAKDWAILQLTSRFVTKQGLYGLDHERPQPPVPDPRRFVREPTEVDEAKLEYYKKCFRERGRSEEEAIEYWEAEMRGESPMVSESEQ